MGDTGSHGSVNVLIDCLAFNSTLFVELLLRPSVEFRRNLDDPKRSSSMIVLIDNAFTLDELGDLDVVGDAEISRGSKNGFALSLELEAILESPFVARW